MSQLGMSDPGVFGYGFAALAVLPGLIVYAVSVQFLTRSIESWFDVKVDAALEGGINLAQQAIDQMSL